MKPTYPDDIIFAWERDFSFFNVYMMTVHHVEELPKRLGKGYRMSAFIYRDGKVSYFRSDSSEKEFDRYVGEKLIQEEGYANEVARRLVEMTDQLKRYWEENKKISKVSDLDWLDETIGEQLIYHMAVYWGADYIASHYPGQYEEVLAMLNRAREHNEDIYPTFEKWIAGQDDLFSLLTMAEAKQFVASGELPDLNELDVRAKCSFVYMNEDGQRYLSSGEKAEADASQLEELTKVRVDEKGSVIRGTTASQGKYKGKVRVITEFEDLKKVESGDVLVVSATRPAYNQYVAKAGAIVTDERSVTSHAAIVAREFKIPCVVGTAIATKVLKDGDIVQVDADKGEIIKL